MKEERGFGLENFIIFYLFFAMKSIEFCYSKVVVGSRSKEFPSLCSGSVFMIEEEEKFDFSRL